MLFLAAVRLLLKLSFTFLPLNTSVATLRPASIAERLAVCSNFWVIGESYSRFPMSFMAGTMPLYIEVTVLPIPLPL